MKALVLEKYNEFVYADVDTPSIGDSDVLIRVKACGICGSDVHGMDGSTGRRQPPVVMGHEASGVIEKTGAAVTGYKEGDRVTFDSTVYCGTCHFCRRGEINLCDNRRVLGVSCDDYRQNGAFAEYVAVPAHILYPLPEGINFNQAAMVEALSIAFHAVNITPVQLGTTAVVAGAGMIGLLVVQALRAAGCDSIIAVDIDDSKLALAQKLGADEGLRADKVDVAAEVKKLTRGRGADAGFEVVGITPTVVNAIESVKKGGACTLVGNVSPAIELPLQSVVTRQIRLQGSCASSGEYPACLDMIARGAVNVDALISAAAPLADGASWFKRLYDKDPGLMKVILNP